MHCDDGISGWIWIECDYMTSLAIVLGPETLAKSKGALHLWPITCTILLCFQSFLQFLKTVGENRSSLF